MKRIVLLICLITTENLVLAQTRMEEKINIEKGQTVLFRFDYTNLINVRWWSENYITVRSNVLINIGKNDNAWVVDVQKSEDEMRITGYIKDRERLPEIITIRKDDQTYYFDTDDWNSPELKDFYELHGREGFKWMSHGLAWEIDIEIMVPANIRLEVVSKHGLIDIEKFNGPVRAESTHGGIDISISSSGNDKFNLMTKWGGIYTDLDFNYTKKSFPQKSEWNNVICSLNDGTGVLIELKSRHGNLYLREE